MDKHEAKMDPWFSMHLRGDALLQGLPQNHTEEQMRCLLNET